MIDRLEIDKGTDHTGLGEVSLGKTIFFCICTEIPIFIVIYTIAATIDIIYTALEVFHIGRGVGDDRCLGSLGVIYLTPDICTDTVLEVLGVHNTSAKVVTTIDVVANPGESKDIVTIGIHTTTADVGLRMS